MACDDFWTPAPLLATDIQFLRKQISLVSIPSQFIQELEKYVLNSSVLYILELNHLNIKLEFMSTSHTYIFAHPHLKNIQDAQV